MLYPKWTRKRMAALVYGAGSPSLFPTYSVARPLERGGLLAWVDNNWKITEKGRNVLTCWYLQDD